MNANTNSDDGTELTNATLDDLEQGDEIEVRYTTTHGNDATLSGRVRSLSESAFTDQISTAVLWDSDEDRTYRLNGTRKVTVASLRSGSPVQVGHSGTVYVEVAADEDDEPELRTDGGDEDDEGPTFTLDLPDYGNVADYADSVDLSDLSDDELERLDDRVTDMLNGDPFSFPSDEALQSASDLSAAIRDEFQDRDPRRDDPHFTPHDSEERYSLDLSAVEVEKAPATTYVRLRFSDGSEWTTRPGLDIANLVRDYLGLDDLRAIGTCVGQSLPVVGEREGDGWVRLDRYALEHDGTTALDDDEENAGPVGTCSECGVPIELGEWHVEDDPDAEDPEFTCLDCSDAENPDENPRVETDGGYRGATDEEVQNAVEAFEDDDSPTLLTDGGQDLPTVEFRERRPDSPNALRGRGPEVQVGEVWATCEICGYYGLVPRSAIPVEGVRCEDCGTDADPSDEDDEPRLVTDGGVPVETDEPADDAELLRVRGEADGLNTLSVYYEAAGETFRARLRPIRPLPEEDHIADREALVLSDISTVSTVPGRGEEWFDPTHVPPVVRRAVDRPVQVPDLGNVEGNPSGR